MCLFWKENLLACTHSIKDWGPLTWQGMRTPYLEMPTIIYTEVKIPYISSSSAKCLFSHSQWLQAVFPLSQSACGKPLVPIWDSVKCSEESVRL